MRRTMGTLCDLIAMPFLMLVAPPDGPSWPERNPLLAVALAVAVIVLVGLVEGGGVRL